jgi:AraC-like DNA-binding protein
MAKENYRLKIPTVSSFEANYYFSEDDDTLPARMFPAHVHDSLELYILLEGDASFIVESTLYRLSAGDAIISKPNEIHNCVLNSASVHKHLCFWFDASCSFLFSDFLSHEFGENNLISPTQENKTALMDLYARLKKSSEEKDERIQFYLMLEMLEIFRRSIVKENDRQNMPSLLQVILEDINENFKTIPTLGYFSQKYFVSQSTLNRLFKEYLHTTPKLYLETKRLAYSRVLLREGQTVFTAAMNSGFTDYSNYIRLFKKRFGMTPRKYQKN